ncbi:MAG: DUF348 domain-containing protein [Anaerolineae bacterium]|nr:DUF348 domain-containing protein [Anaerolineae bacterium]
MILSKFSATFQSVGRGAKLPYVLRRGGAVIAVIFILWLGYIWTGQPITLILNDQPYQLRLHRLTVAAVVHDLGLELAPEDQLEPPLGADLQPGDQVTIRLARPVILEVDGRTLRRLTHQRTIAGLLAEAQLHLNPYDRLLLAGVPVSLQADLPQREVGVAASVNAAGLGSATLSGVLLTARPKPVQVRVQRAVPVTLINGAMRSTFFTTQAEVGAALNEQGLALRPGDWVSPAPASPVTAGMNIYLDRATPVTLSVDGRVAELYTRQATVGQVLAQEKVALMGQDFTRPALDQPIFANDHIEVVRVRETLEISQEFISFETSWVADDTLELDRQEIRQAGATGVIKSRTRVRYENGQEVARQLEDEWLDQVPSDRIVAYGTKIVIRTVETPNGPLEYWRRMPMLVTAYNAAVSGKDADHPRYGITRSGLPAGFGKVAVDPKVIPLMTELYVPEYGPALAADTGGRIQGKHLDLGYDDDQPLPILYEWRDVYVLTPVPPAAQIRYVLPQWPQQ